ncbi:MAG: DUF4172 domain-containing protein [Pseudomonadota bacterium]
MRGIQGGLSGECEWPSPRLRLRETLHFAPRQEASLRTVTVDVVKSSGIEGETFKSGEVRSSIAQRRCITGFSTLKC